METLRPQKKASASPAGVSNASPEAELMETCVLPETHVA